MMTAEQLEITQRVLKGVFGESAPVARIDEDGGSVMGEAVIVVDAFTIMEVTIQVPSIKGMLSVPAYSLDVAVPYRGGRYEPDGCDITDVKTDRSFYAIVLELAQHIARMRADAIMEDLMIEAQVKEWEAERAAV